jgi:hypothetical protein
MTIEAQISAYINSLPAPRRSDIEALHGTLLDLMPGQKLWYLDGRNSEGKVVTNPNIGHGRCTITYKDGSTREFYRIGLSVNTSGISVYFMGLPEKDHLSRHFGSRIGKAKVTGYCIHFKTLKDIDAEVLREAMAYAAGSG